jgi:hypothetical protein
MSYQLSGKIKKVFDRQDFPSGFYKQEFVVTTDDRYPQEIKLDLLKEKVELLAQFKEGDDVTVHFDIRGREWNERWFVDLSAWKIEPAAEGGATSGPPADEEAPAVPAEDPASYGLDDDEEVPF